MQINNFPIPQIKIGIDIAYVRDMFDMINTSEGLILTSREWKEISCFPDKLLRLAGRFACKEAIMKVLGNGINHISFLDIQIFNDKNGKPFAELKGAALHYWQQNNFYCMDISISHHKEYAVAAAVAGSLNIKFD